MTENIDGQQIVDVLSDMGFDIIDTSGSHVIMEYTHPEGDNRVVTIPLQDNLPDGTLRKIAQQTGANDFESWKEWIEANS